MASGKRLVSDSHSAPTGRSSPRRLVILTVIMLGFAALTWGVSLFSRTAGPPTDTAKNLPNVFIPAWLTLTIATVVISMWFAKYILTAEKPRDAETVSAGEHSH